MTSSQDVGEIKSPQRQAALLAAEQFLADTVEAVVPDLPAPVLLDYAARYRAHLAALVAASR